MSIENLVFSAGGGFLFGAVAGYAIKKVLNLAAIVIGLFVVGWSLLSVVQRMDKCKMDRDGECIKSNIDKRNRSVFSCTEKYSIPIGSTFNYGRGSRPTSGSCNWIHARSHVGVKEGIVNK